MQNNESEETYDNLSKEELIKKIKHFKQFSSIYHKAYMEREIKLGLCFFKFNNRLPEEGAEIYYLLGNAIDGILGGLKLVKGSFDKDFADFDKENGLYKYVTSWAYIQKK